MSTSLAEQLQRLAVPQTSQLQRSDKKRASILFDAKEAANLSRETVYQIGLEGFNALKSKNPIFALFEQTLFHSTAKNFERSIQTADANEKLDKTLRRYFHLLSPYFLMHAAHKSLEWLVHRYRIHEFNRDDLILLILPYHDTNIFIRVLQIIDIHDNDRKWIWLKPLQKPGVHLSKNVLYQHAAKNPAFIQLLSKNLLSAIKEHDKPSQLTVWFNFYCSTFVGAIEKASQIDETIVVQMLPSLIKAFKSSIPDFCASACIILSKLLSKTVFSNNTLQVLVERLTKFKVSFLRQEIILTLLVLYQNQPYNEFPTAAINNLIVENSVWFAVSLRELQEAGFLLDSLLGPLLLDTLKYALCKSEIQSKLREFLQNLLNQLKLSEEATQKLFQAITSTKFKRVEVSWMKEMLELIERQYPETFDKEVGRLINDKRQRKNFKKIMTQMKSDTVHLGMELFENLYHPQEDLRCSAVNFLMEKLKGNEVNERNKDLLKNLLIDRLNDESTLVLKETLDTPDEILQQVLTAEELTTILLRLLYKHKFSSLATKIIRKLVAVENSSQNYEVTIALVPYMFMPVDDDNFEYSKSMKCLKIIVTHFVPENTTIHNMLKKEPIDAMHFGEFFKKDCIKNLKMNQILAAAANSANCDEPLFKYTLALIIGESAEFQPEAITLLAEQCKSSVFTNCKDTECNDGDYFLAAQTKLPIVGYMRYVEKFILKMPPKMLYNSDLCKTDELTQSYVELFNFLLHGAFLNKGSESEVFGKAMKTFFQQFCPNNSEIEFLLNYACCENVQVSAAMQLRALRSVRRLFQEMKHKKLPQDSLYLPCLLMALSNSHSEIRITALECLRFVDYQTPCIKAILEAQVEITQDEQQLPVILSNYFQKTKSTRIFAPLANIVHSSAPIYVKCGVVLALSKLDDPSLYKDIVKICKKGLEDTAIGRRIAHTCIEQFSGTIAAATKSGDEIWSFLKYALENDKVLKEKDFTSPAIALINTIRKDVYAQFAPSLQKDVLDVIITMTTTSSNPELMPAATKFFKHIDLDASAILHHLEMMRDVKSAKVQSKLRRRISIVPTIDILDTLGWKHGLTVLEFIQDKKKMRNIHQIVPVLFEVLKKCLDFDEQSGVEYPKQLILTSILHFCDKIDPKVLPENVFNMELVVQCIRASQNPQTHHHALLVLAKVAEFLPNQVLHHIMAIFTFMGSSVLRRDDAYSFQIITKIIETIIPILVRDQERNTKCIIDVSRVFVDVILDVPEHRRMALYHKFLEQINPMESLHIFMLLIFESHVLSQQQTKESASKRLDIAKTLCLQFSPDIVINNCIKLFEYLKMLPVDKCLKREGNMQDLDSIFDMQSNIPKQFRHYKYTLIQVTANLVACKTFVNNVAKLSVEQSELLEEPYKKMIVNVLTYIQSTSKVAELNVDTPQSQYWKVMLHLSYDILDSLNALLTSQMFILVIKGLMTHQLSTVRRRALELLNSKLQHSPEFFQDCERNELYTMIPPLIVIIKEVENGRLDTDQEIIIQTALLSLKLFIRLLATQNPPKFVQILNFITELIKSKINNNILASAVLCIAELCTNLRSHCISALNKFMPALLKILKRQLVEETPSLLLISVITTLQKLLDVLSLFMSPYLQKLLESVCTLSAKWSQSEDGKISQFVAKLSNIRGKIAELIPARILIPAIEQTYLSIIAKTEYTSIGPLMEILSGCVSNLTGNDVKQSLPDLSTFFLRALEVRAEASDENSTHVDTIEAHVINALTNLILKLSETSFRPLFYKLYDWALRSDEKSAKAITFYALSASFANALKGLFVLFAGHILSNAATLLDACNATKTTDLFFSNEQRNVKLVENVLATLNFVFLHANQKFINRERFDCLMQPLADQLDNTLGDDFQQRIRSVVIPTLVNFTVATGDDALWKQLNYQILLKTRDSTPAIRLLALECLRDICKKVGEDFLPLLPETIPFLAELLEDEEEQIEKACQKTIQELEKVLGEPLQNYF